MPEYGVLVLGGGDAAGRVCLAGWDGLYEPTIVVRHHHGRKEDDLAAIRKRDAIGSGGYRMLLEERRLLHFLHYLGGLPRRYMQQPSALYWEALGVTRFGKHPRRQTPLAQCGRMTPIQSLSKSRGVLDIKL